MKSHCVLPETGWRVLMPECQSYFTALFFGGAVMIAQVCLGLPELPVFSGGKYANLAP
jgi:hypothetical protein